MCRYVLPFKPRGIQEKNRISRTVLIVTYFVQCYLIQQVRVSDKQPSSEILEN